MLQIIYRCSSPLAIAVQIFPLLNADADTEGVFKPLFQLLALVLIVVRLNAAWALRETEDLRVLLHTARVTALVHIAEAVYYTGVVFGENGTLPLDPSRWYLRKHGEALLVYTTIIVNAALFGLWWLQIQLTLNEKLAAKEAQLQARAAAAADADQSEGKKSK